MATATRLTAAQFLAVEPDGRRTELIDGEVIVHEPRWWHQQTLGHLYATLWHWCREAPGRGTIALPLDVRMDDYTVLAPDLLWFRPGRTPRPDGAQDVPDLAVEVRSPSTWRYDIGRKKAKYEAHGLLELWLVDHDAVLVFRRAKPDGATFDVELELTRGDSLTSPLLPGLAIDVADLLAAATI